LNGKQTSATLLIFFLVSATFLPLACQQQETTTTPSLTVYKSMFDMVNHGIEVVDATPY
jgi:hypothetical protein